MTQQDNALPAPAQAVVDECVAEAWRNTENSDVHSQADVAADIAQRLFFLHRVRASDDSHDVGTIRIHERGAEAIQDMKRQALAIEEAWKSIDPAYGVAALRSLAHNLAELFGGFFGQNTGIFRDGDLSLFVRTDRIVFGVIFHRKHLGLLAPGHLDVAMPVVGDADMSYGAPFKGRYCMRDDVTAVGGYCAKPFTWRGNEEGGTPTCEGHEPWPVTMPVPGDWSFHS